MLLLLLFSFSRHRITSLGASEGERGERLHRNVCGRRPRRRANISCGRRALDSKAYAAVRSVGACATLQVPSVFQRLRPPSSFQDGWGNGTARAASRRRRRPDTDPLLFFFTSSRKNDAWWRCMQFLTRENGEGTSSQGA